MGQATKFKHSSYVMTINLQLEDMIFALSPNVSCSVLQGGF